MIKHTFAIRFIRQAAALIGRTDFDVYFDEVISAGLPESGDENVFRKIFSDLQYADVGISAQNRSRENDAASA
ncbi:ATPase inhibitor subunit zeta [Rhizobium bangladeshense]|uniref:ATPase inhibitor subunit zeta n=1 Tax=Rhizobium bangladeshense TaxID=1138189 RepID=UPI001C834A77|nr:ATPase inhibitor subunit zeta [Rhizobium bangladeshense]MBX4893236.1 DUF1476 family protein [Rhizobium bangladeshense]MBX4898828.1 DUF1476 family protein [Rhizobium bangladeshense]MBY3616874.1 DUF1476 family protein [Rhizobium bangladeshense]